MTLPDYHGGSIVNLMTSILLALGGANPLYPPLRGLNPSIFGRAANIVLLVVDGLGYSYLCNAGAGSTLHRYLNGSMTSVFPSTTASAITTFLTGIAPQQHAVTGWHMYLREIGAVAAIVLFTARHGGQSLSGLGLDAHSIFDHSTVFDQIDAQSYVIAPERIVSSEFNRAHRGRASVRSYGTLIELFETIEQIVLQGGGRRYIYAYWPELDRLAHEHGVADRAVATRFVELDRELNRFLRAIQGSRTVTIVTADHGIIDSGSRQVIELDDHPRCAQALALPLCGERRVAYCYVRPGKEQQFEAYVRTELAAYTNLFRSEELLARGYFGLGPPHPRLRERIGHYTLVMKENYVIKDWLPGEHRHVHIGVHGGLSRQEMYVPLVLLES